MAKYFADERRSKLAQYINDRGSCGVGDLAKRFNVTMETIRKDIIYLDEHKLVRKMHGGAFSLNKPRERPMEMRSVEHMELKERIAAKALEYIEDNQVILLDSGTTVLTFCHMIDLNRKVTFMTNSVPAALALSEKEYMPTLIGGSFSHNTLATSGMIATQTLDIVKADIVFLGASGFHLAAGPSAEDFCDAQVKKDMMRNSRKRIVIADSSKMATDAFVRFAAWSEIDILITDDGAAAEAVETLRKQVRVDLV